MQHQTSSASPPLPKILLFAYAFPPMQVQMTAAILKPMAALVHAGCEVDVVCADAFCPHLPQDNSLIPFAEATFAQITRLAPSHNLLTRAYRNLKIFSHVPDLMQVLHRTAYTHLMDRDLSAYDAVMTWSPFHSINPVMARVKQQRPQVKWLAQFGDPWAGNPIQTNRLTQFWDHVHEPKTLRLADYIVHTAEASRSLMLQGQPDMRWQRSAVVPHAYLEALYPKRPKKKNAKVTLRYVGVLFGKRSPEPLFLALHQLLIRHPTWRDRLTIELVGSTPLEMLRTEAASTLPEGMVISAPSVNYLQSLELMYDADILLLIEADVRNNLFLPSKITDYLGANTPIVGITSAGASAEALQSLGCWQARPDDITGISNTLEAAIDHVVNTPSSPWYDMPAKEVFSSASIASQYLAIFGKL